MNSNLDSKTGDLSRKEGTYVFLVSSSSQRYQTRQKRSPELRDMSPESFEPKTLTDDISQTAASHGVKLELEDDRSESYPMVVSFRQTVTGKILGMSALMASGGEREKEKEKKKNTPKKREEESG